MVYLVWVGGVFFWVFLGVFGCFWVFLGVFLGVFGCFLGVFGCFLGVFGGDGCFFWVFLAWLFVAAKNQGLLGRHNKVIAEIFLGTSYIWGYIWLYMVIYGYIWLYGVLYGLLRDPLNGLRLKRE